MGHQMKHRKQEQKNASDPLSPCLLPVSSRQVSLLQLHPAFYHIYEKCENHLLLGDGPLPLDYRHFIAILACSRYGSESLVEVARGRFLAVGGEKSWLEGLHKAPSKLQRLADINKVLAHRPWALDQTHLKDLTSGQQSWSIAEIVQAIVIMVHCHSACSFAFGSTAVASSAPSASSKPSTSKSSSPSATSSSLLPSLSLESNKTTGGATARTVRFQEGKADKKVDPSSSTLRSSTVSSQEQQEQMPGRTEEKEQLTTASLPPSLAPFLGDSDTTEEENHAHHAEILHLHDFSWDEQGFSVMSRFYGDMSLLLDDKFRTARSMAPNTSAFRRAIWNYIQSLYGILQDDYDYGELRVRLEPSLRQLMRTACWEPATIQADVVDTIMLNLTTEEKVHVKILIMEAKRQALLLYAMRAVTYHMM